MKQPITLILLGDIAAGKGTQAKILVKKFKFRLISTGAYTRKFWTGTSKISRRLEKTKLGKLTPSDIIQVFLHKSLSKLPHNLSILIDGGKMPKEAKLIHSLLTKQGRKILVIYLRIPQREIFRRLRWRYYCEKTGQPLVIKSNLQKCPHCGGGLIKRADDDPQAIKNRIAYYRKVYSRTVKFWQGKKVLKFINGKQSAPAVTRDIAKTIRNFYAVW